MVVCFGDVSANAARMGKYPVLVLLVESLPNVGFVEDKPPASDFALKGMIPNYGDEHLVTLVGHV
jgi:hypothetical protein